MKFLILCFLTTSFLYAQPMYDITGRYKEQSAQGMTIWGGNAFLLNNTGLCRMYNLKKRSEISTFVLGSAGKNNHANCISVGVEKRGRQQPVMYVSECASPYRCFVEDIMDSCSVLVQTISLKRFKKEDMIVHDWIVDRRKKAIYTIANLKSFYSKEKRAVHRVTQYRLPELAEGENVVLTDDDVRSSFDVEFPNLLQGGSIRGKYLYLPVGLHSGNEKRLDAKRALIVVDLKKQRIAKTISLDDLTENEPEDCDFYKGKLLLFCGQSGGIYEIPYK